MSKKVKVTREYRLTPYAMAGLVTFIFLVAAAGLYTGSSIGSQVTTIANTTLTSTSTAVEIQTSTYTYVQATTLTQTTFSIVTYIGPDSVTMQGTAHSNGIGTSATEIKFVDAATNMTYTANVNAGKYSYALPNHAFYNVKIDFTTAVGGIGSGSCSAGGIAYFVGNATAIVANWSC